MTTGTSDLEELRNRLLDLTLRNNLLNYKPSAARSIEIIESNLAGIYNTLILDEKGMKFHPGEKDTSSAPEEKNIWKYPIFSKSSKHTDSTLATPYTDIELRKKLYSLQNKSRTVFEEQGYPTLYLALGFVQWTENESSKQLKAPLLLLPVDLERQKIKENYTLRWTGEDPVVSLSLSAKFAEQGIELPDLGHPDTAAEVGAFFDAVEETIKSKGWTLCPEIVLDLFSFKKYVMFKDLDPASWGEDFSIEDNPLIDSIFNPTEAPAETADLPQTGECFNIVDADSSQLAVIREAKAGKNLVVEGPPGTGKSQTIANMIAEMLAAGKTVLFVSEKMAALEVVKRRLDGAGLSRFCLELHSQTAKKVEFIRELERCIQHPTSPAAEVCDTTKIDALKTELSGYCSELREPIGACGFSPYDLFGIREQYRYEFESSPGRQNYRLPKVAVENASAITPEDYQAAVSALADIESYLPSILKDGETLSSHPWAETRPGMILPSDRDEIHDLTVAYRDGVERLVCAMRAVSDAAGIPLPHSETDIPLMMEICRSLTSEFTATPEILSNRLWDNTEAVDRLISRMKKLSETRRKLLGIFTPEIFDRNPARLYSEFMKYSEKNVISKLFSGDFKRLKEELRSYYGGSLPTDAVILSDLKEARNYLTDRDGWLSEERSYRSLFEPVWDGEDTDASVLFEYRNWVLAIRTMIAEGLITEQTVMHIADGTLGPDVMAGLFAELEAAAKAHSEESALLFERLGIDEVSEDITFAQMRRTADVWITEIDRLEEWSKFLSYAEVCAGTAAAQILPLIMTDKIDHDALIPAFLTGYADALLKEAYQQRPILAHFSQMPHEQKIAAFREFDLQMVSSNAKRLVQILDGNIPELFTGASRESEMGVLTGEFNRKRGHMSIRSLMTKSGSLIQKIKPCFMMSPLSVAQYLDPRSVMFDIIIFDEASQVKPEDALGALMRGRQLVVMGDSRQLPPTTFFDQIGGEESDEEEESTAGITDMESLLHVCKQSFVTKRLRWHYRSRHESLIAVSNAEFYDGTLQVFPSPMHDTEDVGLSFVHVEDSVYERGKAGVNRGEAKAVAEAVIDYYRRFPNKTLGVATFSTKQQELIRREVDLLLRDNPDVESLMRPENGEHFFVKNLETVQGDERDTMLISIGYGFDENHRLSRNFGPLNQTGGERRLNVLITRARERCVVFANFRGYDLAVESDTPDGVAALSAFLTYAETRNAAPLSAGEDISPDVADLFPETVARMLEDNGYTVARNVGCAGFRIDLAVLHPETEGVYMAGILCDGPFYWSAADARDRDRLRGQVLEGLGWNLIRIWSPEWFQHPASCTKVLLDFLVDAAKKEPLKLSVEPEIPVVEAVEEIEEEPAEEVPLSTVLSSACFVPYVCCDSCVLQSYNQFASVHDSVLQTGIVEIVRAEGPISESLLIARIKELGSVPRMTAAIKERIANLAEASVAEGTLTRDADKFYSLSGGELTARKREGKWSISDVSLDEIALAARIVLEKQFATPMSDLIKQTAASLGFKATAQVKQRIEAGIAAASTSGLIVEENGVWKAV